MAETAAEVMRLRAEKAKTSAPEVAGVLQARIATLSNQWCAQARAAGMKPPTDSFDAFRATDEQLRSAILWTEVGNTYPVSALQDGGAHFRDELLLAHAVRSPVLLGQLVERMKDHPERLIPALHRELQRLGDTRPCSPNDTVDSLLARRSEALRLQSNGANAHAADEARQRVTIGVDGRVGKLEDVITSEMEQQILAANPGTTLGAVLAATSAGDVEGMRRRGKLGNAVEGVAGPFGRVKASDLKPYNPDGPTTSPHSAPRW
jgi:hypothetical protein